MEKTYLPNVIARRGEEIPCGGHGTQQGGLQNESASNPVIVPGPMEIGRSGPPHCVVVMSLEMLIPIVRKRDDLLLGNKFRISAVSAPPVLTRR